MKGKRRLLALAVALTLILALAACATPAPADAAGAPADQADGDAEYAVILITFSNQFYQDVRDGILAEAEKLGVKVDVYAANSEEDVTGQVAILENCISKGYKCIGVAPISTDNLNNAITDANSKGIYVVNIDEQVNLEGLKAMGGHVSALVSTDNHAVGELGASYIVDQIGGAGKVAIIEGKAGANAGESRKAGAIQGFDRDGIEIVESQPGDWDRTKGYDIATNYINKHPDLKGIYCCNDTMAMGALEAVKNAGADIVVVGTDGNEDAIQSVQDGELNATIAQDTQLIGARGLQVMVQVAQAGEPIDPEAEPYVEMIDPILVAR